MSNPDDLPTDYRLNDRGRPVKSVEHTLAALTSIVGGLSRRRRRPDAGLNDDLDLGELTQLISLREAVEYELAQGVLDLYAKGYSWTEIAHALGVTRQAALKRYGPLAALAGLTGAERQ